VGLPSYTKLLAVAVSHDIAVLGYTARVPATGLYVLALHISFNKYKLISQLNLNEIQINPHSINKFK
jgi:hypothetical protein